MFIYFLVREGGLRLCRSDFNRRIMFIYFLVREGHFVCVEAISIAESSLLHLFNQTPPKQTLRPNQ
jgi:hypothetical protein